MGRLGGGAFQPFLLDDVVREVVHRFDAHLEPPLGSDVERALELPQRVDEAAIGNLIGIIEALGERNAGQGRR